MVFTLTHQYENAKHEWQKEQPHALPLVAYRVIAPSKQHRAVKQDQHRRACCGMLLLADSTDLSKLDILRRWHVDQC